MSVLDTVYSAATNPRRFGSGNVSGESGCVLNKS